MPAAARRVSDDEVVQADLTVKADDRFVSRMYLPCQDVRSIGICR